MRGWVRDPNAGGVKVPATIQTRITKRIEAFAAAQYAGKYTRLGIRFRGAFCYIDVYKEPDPPGDYVPFNETREEYVERLRNMPVHLCRLRYFGDEDSWGFAFYTYSHEKYELCYLDNGTFYGSPEEAFRTAAVYLCD